MTREIKFRVYDVDNKAMINFPHPTRDLVFYRPRC